MSVLALFSFSPPSLISSSQVFVMGYYLGESTDTSVATQDDPTIPTLVDQRRIELRYSGKMETHDRIIGIGPKVTETSIVEVRYEIKTSAGATIDNNRRSNTRNSELVSTSPGACVSLFQHPR